MCQYSSQFVGRKTKRDMVAGAARRHPDSTILDARALGKVRRFARRHMGLA